MSELRTSDGRARTDEPDALRRRLLIADIAERFGDLFLLLDAGERITFIDDRALRAAGRRRDELLGCVLWEAFPVYRGTELERAVGRALRGGAEVRYEALGPVTGRWMEVTVCPTPEGAAVLTRDVDDRRRADQERSLLAAIVESSDDAIISMTPAGVITSWNRGAERLFGHTAAAAVGRPDTLIVPPERQDEEERILERVRRGERVEHFETVRVAQGGRRVDVSLTVSPVRDAAGVIVGASKVARDVTARQQTEERLRRSEDRFARFMQHLPGLAWIKDLEGRYVYANAAAARAFGVPLERLYGRTDAELFPPETAAQFVANDRTALDALGGLQTVETLAQDDGVVHHSVVSKFPIPGPDGKPALVGGMAVDITERVRAEEALREADRRKDEFLAILGHELRNPLAPIRNALEILRQRGSADPEAQLLHEMMERQVRTLSRLTDEMLDISRVTRGKVELRRELVDVAAVVGRAVEAGRPAVEQRGHRLTVALPAGPLRVWGDPVRLEQVLTNLLNNAAKYTPPGGSIWLEAQGEDRAAVVRVRDTGIGIRPEVLPRLFEPFQQADRVPGRVQEGLGIGLAVVRGLVELHGGTVEVHSEGAGKGSEFIVRLPLAAAPNAPASAGGPGDDGGGRRLRVLVVDDNVDAAEGLALLLRMKGHEVRCAHDGPAALDAGVVMRPDLVLLDIGMPGMDGCEVARRWRAGAGPADALLVAVTGYGQEDDRARSRAAGFDEHFVKPISPQALGDILARAAR